MPCVHVNIRTATFIIISVIVNNIAIIQMDDKTEDTTEPTKLIEQPETENVDLHPCSEDFSYEDVDPQDLYCSFNMSCIYGELMNVTCKYKNFKKCPIEKQLVCRYCYQTEPWEHNCELRANCNSVASPRIHYTTNCTVNRDVLCLGNRTFNKNVLCNWTGGYRWTTALILSITLGGFGADRFYLGHWQEGIGKLFSFGGLGVWTIIDVILISLHYLGPADGSLYI